MNSFEEVWGDEEPVLRCERCGGGIYDGDKYFDYFGESICTDCIMPVLMHDCGAIAQAKPAWEKRDEAKERMRDDF